MSSEERILSRLRRICLKLPEARETTTLGQPTFQAGKRTFAVLEEYRGHLVLCFKTTPVEQTRLCKEGRFFVAPTIGRHGWTCLTMEGNVDWSEVARLVVASYCLVAPRRMMENVDL